MKVLARLLVVVAAVCASALIVERGAFAWTTAAAASPADDGKASCAQTWANPALDDTGANSSFNWTAGKTMILWMRCQYDKDVTGPALYPGTRWFTGSTTPPSSWVLYWQRDSSTLQFASGTGTSGYVWSNYVELAKDLANGYIEFMVTIKRWTVTITHGQTVPLAKANICWDKSGAANVATCTATTGTQSETLGFGSSTTANAWTVAYSDWITSCALCGPQYYWGTSGYSPINPWCGASVEVTSHDLDDIVEPGDVLNFETTWTSSVTEGVWVRFSTSTSWWSIFVQGTIANPALTSITVPDVAPFSWRVRDLDLRCLDERYPTYMNEKDVEDEVESPTSEARPCAMARFYPAELGPVSAGQVISVRVQYSGTLPSGYSPTTLDVEYATYDESLSYVPGSSTVSWTSLFNDLALGSSATANMTAAYDGTTAQFTLRCTDASGVYSGRQWHMFSGVEPGDESSSTRDRNCLGNSGIGFQPSSWVPGLASIGSCILRALFVPSSGSVQALFDSAEAATEKAPVSFIAESGSLIYTAVDGADSAVLAGRGGCLTVFPGMSDIDVEAQEVCPSTLDSSALSTARTILGAMFWLGFAWMLWTLTRKLISE